MRRTAGVLTAAMITLNMIGFNLVGARAGAQEYKVLHNFGPLGGPDGKYPDGAFPSDLLIDSKGNLFGTSGGGPYGAGTVFELSPVADGGWEKSVLYNFTFEEGGPPTSGLTPDGKGNFFGTLVEGFGLVFELSPAPDGGWTERTIYDFNTSHGSNGHLPIGVLTIDAQGNLYGVTEEGGANGYSDYGQGDGVVYELMPSPGGTWTEKVLYNFGATPMDAETPSAGLVIDAAGNLYGTTVYGSYSVENNYEGGTVFELTQADGTWTEKILHSFDPATKSGYEPVAPLFLDGKGNIFGTTDYGGAADTGTVFKLSPSTAGNWTETDIFSFSPANGYGTPPFNVSGIYPSGALTMDGEGNLYGTTSDGGIYSYDYFDGGRYSGTGGTVYKLTPQAGGPWVETVLHSFPATTSDGLNPVAGLVFDSAGNLYGTTSQGGDGPYVGGGTVFEIEDAGTSTKIGTTTFLTISSPNGYLASGTPLVAGAPVTLSVQVIPAVVGAVPTGTVTFIDPAGGSVTEAINAGVATYNGIVPQEGTYSVYASYSGSNAFAPSISATVAKLVITNTKTTTTLVANPSANLVVGEPITLTATVAATEGTAIPPGTVTFADPAFPGGNVVVPLIAGVATYQGTVAVPYPGTFEVFATYNGATGFVGSNSAYIKETVTAPPSR